MQARDTSATEAHLRSLPTAHVAALAAFALGEAGWAPSASHAERLRRPFGTASGVIFRVSGTAEHDGQARPWSVILKVVRPAAWRTLTKGSRSGSVTRCTGIARFWPFRAAGPSACRAAYAAVMREHQLRLLDEACALLPLLSR